MNSDQKELVEYLDKKFNKIDECFEELQNVFATKEEMKEIVSSLVTKEDFNALLTSVDAYAKKADGYFQEMLMLAKKVDRHETWLNQIAAKLDIKLEY